MFTVENEYGFTLFEVLVYIGLFSLIMFGALVGAFQIIDSSNDTRQRVMLEQEAHFIFRKIDWMTNGNVVDVDEPSQGVLFVDRVPGLDNATFAVNGDGVLTLNTELLTASGVNVSDFDVEIIPPSGDVPKAVEVSFKLNDRWFATTTRYIR